MTGLLADRCVLVTGAGDGVGRGIALACAAAGADVVVTAPRENRDETVKQIESRGGSAISLACDVTHRGEVEGVVAAAVERFGRLDALVHNATSRLSPIPDVLAEVSEETLEGHVGVSLRGSFYCAQAAFEPLRARGGRFVLLTSPAGIEGSPTLPLYSAVKAGQRAFMKSLAQEWGPLGIAVNAISPLSATPALVRAFEANPALEERLRALTPLGRVGDPETDIGNAAVLLLSPRAHYIAGQTWVVDGGRFMGL